MSQNAIHWIKKINYCNGYCLGNYSKKSNKGTLYKCTNDSGTVTCTNEQKKKVPIGYFSITDEYNFNIKSYIKCNGKYCEAIDKNTLKDVCNSLGDLVMVRENIVYMCINENYMIEFSDDDIYMVVPNIEKNLFNNSIYKNYSIIKITQNSITLVTDTEQFKDGKYIFSNDIYENDFFIQNDSVQIKLISLKIDDKGKINIENLNTTDSYPFKTKGNNYGVMIEDLSQDFTEDELEEIFLLQCINGECFNIPGYVKYNTASDEVKVAECDEFCFLYQGPEECNAESSGKVYYDSVSQKFMICMNQGDLNNNVFEAKEIVSSSSFIYYLNISGKEDTYYNLYISNKDGSIISKNSRDGYIIYDVDKNGKNKLLLCNKYDCYKRNLHGYIINIINQDENNNMVYCEEECQVVPKNNGYYINSNLEYGVVKCESSICEFMEDEDIDEHCYRNYFEIIFDEDYFLYCHNLTLMDFPDEVQYFPVNINVSASKFPVSISPGQDIILIRLGKYSVQQYITGKDGNN
ncbi:hypothetical protein PIROE2DRAFT_3455 [Piromyces sp. E2]|nr:hypothetical protein PIROE2DRAFT_3455 [Piromyces sp. E2]|eukprot:OUM68766.1 hypothetical protein PIROE2DRAFT_3455 [Piromyces sp. E2]